MQCENEYCVYYKENKCVLEQVEIDSLGMCATCIRISLDESFLLEERKRQLQEINSRWKT